MKILHITNNDYDGAGLAVIRLHNSLMSIGIDSHVALLFKKHNNDNVSKIGYSRPVKKLLFDFVSLKILFDFKKIPDVYHFLKGKFFEKILFMRFQPKQLFNFNLYSSKYSSLKEKIKGFDVLVLHSIQGVILPEHILKIHNELRIKIVMHPLDMETITGGCHFNYECGKWMEKCGDCFQINTTSDKDISMRTLLKKKYSYRNIPIHWIATNSFMQNRLISSTVTSIKHKFSTVFLSVDKDRCLFIEKNKARDELKLPKNKKIILFGCFNFHEKRKGAGLLKEIIRESFNHNDTDKECLVTFGEGNGFSFEGLDIEWIHMGSITENYKMNALYQASDLLVSPSLDDLGPLVVVEAFMNNLSIVAFKIGVALDLVIHDINGNLVNSFNSQEFGELVRKNIFSLKKSTDKNKKIEDLQNKFSAKQEALLLMNAILK